MGIATPQYSTSTSGRVLVWHGHEPPAYVDASVARATIGAGTGNGDLLAANNLSDVASATTSLTNLGGTTIGKELFTAPDVATARSDLLIRDPLAARVSFGNTNFQFIPTNPNQYKLPAWTTVEFDIGDLYTAEPNLGAAFIPPAGTKLIVLNAAVWIVSGIKTTGNASVTAKWVKNATIDGNGILLTSTEIGAGLGSKNFWGADSGTIHANCIDVPSPGDYYALFFYVDTPTLGSTVVTVDGNPYHTYMMAHTLA